jgi:hypothetical protein
MIRAAFILSFDRDDSTDYKKLHDSITSLPRVLNWFHYVKSSYILISDTNFVNTLNEDLAPIFGKKSYLLIKLDLMETNGYLPPKAWDWIDRQIIDESVDSVFLQQYRYARRKIQIISEGAKSFKIGKTGQNLEDRLSEPDYDGIYTAIVPLIKDSNPNSISHYESALIDRFIGSDKCDNVKDGDSSEGDRMANSRWYYVYMVWK